MHQDQPLISDVFDSTGDGFTPYPIAKLAAAARRAEEALEELLLALHGSATPLNLREAAQDINRVQLTVAEHSRQINDAARVIISDAPLAKIFRGDAEPWAGRTEGATGVALSPKQILALASQAAELLPSATTSYARAVNGHDVVPPLIAAKRREAARNRSRDEFRDLIDSVLLDMESRACAKCGAEPGAYCISSGGRITSPHAARRHASPLAAEHREAAKYVSRTDPGAGWNKPLTIKEPEEVVENRELLGEVFDMISSKFTDLDR